MIFSKSMHVLVFFLKYSFMIFIAVFVLLVKIVEERRVTDGR